MADNTPIVDASSVTENIATDELATLNGVDVTAVSPRIKAQRTKVGYGSDGAFTDVDATHGLPVVVESGTVTVQDGGGAVSVDDNDASLSVDDGGGSLTVDGSVAVTGTVTVDSELTTADLDTGAGTDTRAVVGVALAASGGAQLLGAANPLPVTDNGATLSVDDGAGSLTVDGTVAATVADGADVAIGATTDAEATANGSVVAILKRLRTLLAGGLPGALGPNGGLKVDPTSAVAISQATDTIAAALKSDALMVGTLEGSNLTALTPKFAQIAASASGATTVVAAVASKKIRVLGFMVVCNGAVSVKWQSHTTTATATGAMPFAANGGISTSFSPVGWFETVAGEALDINLSGAVTVGGQVVYVEV